MSRTTRRGRRRALALVCSTTAVGAAGLIGISSAQAASASLNCSLSGGEICRPTDVKRGLTSVSSYSGSDSVRSGAAGTASGSTGDTYGKWYYGTPSACRVFGGSTQLFPLLTNVNGGQRTIYGGITWGSGSSGC